MKITLDNERYHLELNADGVTGKGEEEVKEFATSVLCRLLLEMVNNYTDDEYDAEMMRLNILQEMIYAFDEIFGRDGFDEFHRRQVEGKKSLTDAEEKELYLFMERDFEEWAEENVIDVENFQDLYKDCEQLKLVITKEYDGMVTVNLTDGTNNEILFCYSPEQMEEEDFKYMATRDLMHLEVLGDKVFGEEKNPLRDILPKDYVERCIKAAH